MADPIRPLVTPAPAQFGARLRLDALAPALRRVTDLATVAAIGSWLGFFIVTLWPGIALDVFRATALFHLVAAAVLVPYVASLVVRRRLPGGSPLDVPAVTAIGAYLLATVASENWRISLEASLIPLLAVSAFFVLSDAQLFQRRQVELGLMLAALAGGVRAIWLVGDDYLDWLRLNDAVSGGLSASDLIPPTVPRVEGVGDHANMLGMALAMALPFFVAGVLRRDHPLMRLACAAGGAVVALALFLTLSRGAWLGSLAGCAFVVAASAALLPGGRALLLRVRDELTVRRWLLAFAAFAALAFVAAAGLYTMTRWETRPEWLFRESGSPRWDVATTAGEVIQDYPLTGAGPDTFGLLYPEYSGKYPRYHYHAHNGFLQTAVDAGVPGVLAMFALGGGLAWLFLRARPRDDATRLTLIAAAGAIVAFGVHAQLDAPNQSKTVLLTLAAVGAVAALAYRESHEETGAIPRAGPSLNAVSIAARALVPVAMVGLLITWGRIDSAHFYYSNGIHNANVQDWDQAIDDTRRAVELDPSFALYRLQLGVTRGQAYLDSGDREQLAGALGQLERAVELEPRSGIAHANLALLLAEAEEPEPARAAARSALRFANSDVAVVLAAGNALERAGWEDDAVDAYARALFYDVGLADSPFWTSSEFRETHYDDIFSHSAIIFNPCLLLELSTAGQSTGAISGDDAFRSCADAVASGAGDDAGKVVLADALIERGEVGQAKELLDDVVTRLPDFGPARTVLGRWYAEQGRMDDARHQWVLAGQLDEVHALVLLGESYAPASPPPEVIDALRARVLESASEVQFHLTGILYYRRSFYRESPLQILLPGEWQDAVPRRFAEAEDALERWGR